MGQWIGQYHTQGDASDAAVRCANLEGAQVAERKYLMSAILKFIQVKKFRGRQIHGWHVSAILAWYSAGNG